MSLMKEKILHCLMAAFISVAFLGGCDRQGSDQAAKAPALRVLVSTSEQRDVPLSIDMVGSTLGTKDVPIRARVEGFLESVEFM